MENARHRPLGAIAGVARPGTRRRSTWRQRDRRVGRGPAGRDGVSLESWNHRRQSAGRHRRARRLPVHASGAGTLQRQGGAVRVPRRRSGKSRRQRGRHRSRRPQARARERPGVGDRVRSSAASRYHERAQSDRHGP